MVRHFIPYLWRNIDLKWNIDTESLLPNQRHVLFIASLVEFPWQPLDSIVNLSFPNLQKITKGEHFDRDSDKSLPPQLLNLLSQTTFLDTLFLFISDNTSKELTQYLPSALQRLPNLTNLDLSIFSPTTLELIRHVIYNSRHCRLFHLTVSLRNNPTTVEAEDFRASIGRLTNTKFQDLKIHILNTEVDLDIIAPLVEQSPLLELFYLHRPYKMDTLHRILCVLQDKTRRPLKFLGVEENLEEAQPEYWKSLQELFHEVSGERRNYFTVKESTPTTIHFKQSRINTETSNDDFRLGIDKSMLEKLPFYFSHTLTSIQLLSMHLDWFLVSMSQLPLLQSVIASVTQRTSGSLIHTFEPTETHNLFWPCSRMKKLDIFVGMGSTINAMITHLFKELENSTSLKS